ncbi:hypothetical protein [Arthrobacter sp. MMS24-S77]
MDELSLFLPLEHSVSDFTRLESLPEADLVLSCAGMPYVPREDFQGFWELILVSLRPGVSWRRTFSAIAMNGQKGPGRI